MAGLQRSQGLSKACILLIAISGMERFAFKGVASNLVTYLTDVVKMSNSAAAKTVNNWCGLTSIMPLLVAPLAESLWDRFFTIIAFSFLYILGLVAVTYTAFNQNKEISSYSFLFLSLCIISLGQGGYNPSLQAFAANQLGDEDELPCSSDSGSSNAERRSRFFTMWYFGICAGSLMGNSFMAYVQDRLGWGIGFAIPTMAMVLSILFFTCGTRLYSLHCDHDDKDKESPLKKLIRLVKAVVRRVRKGRDPAKDAGVDDRLQKRSLCEQDGNDQQESSHVKNAKVVLKLLPIWTMLLIFAVIFQQPATFFTKQGMTMKRSLGSKLKIPPATLQSTITISVIVSMPLYDKFLIPLAKKMTRNERGISVMQRMGVGMVLSTLAMVIAALVEEKRLKMSLEMGNLGGLKSDLSVPMSIFWLLPQYVLLGVADIFTVVGMQEFFYGEVPIKMRTMGIALYTSVFGVGSFMSSVLISLIEVYTRSGKGSRGGGWFSDDMRHARIDKYYWLLAVLSSCSFVIYTILCRCYRSNKE